MFNSRFNVLRENVGVWERERLAQGNSLHLISWETDHALEEPSNRCAHNSSCAPRLLRTSNASELIRIEDKPEGSIFWEWIERPSLPILPRRMIEEEGLEVTLTAGPTEAANCYAAPLLSRWAAEQARSQLQPGQPHNVTSHTGEQRLWPRLGSFLQGENKDSHTLQARRRGRPGENRVNSLMPES